MRYCFAVVLLAVLAVACGSRTVRFEGTSMLPGIKDGDRLVVERVGSEISRGDIVMHRYPKNLEKFYIKRVIGLPGETVEIREGRVLVNGDAISEPYVSPEMNRNGRNLPPVRIPTGEYFVLGDNRDNSSDSRSWGNVERSLITGRVRLTY